jgi:hypothetical protein
MAAYSQTSASENADAPEIDACRASGLIALKERSPTIKDVELDLDSVRVIKMGAVAICVGIDFSVISSVMRLPH